jgi:SAM-dependent methyltransferase
MFCGVHKLDFMADAYHTDLAYIHDDGHGFFARSAAPVLLDALRQHDLNGGLVIDLGCGSGILAAEVTAAGYDVLGIDISPAMIALARKRAPRARFRVESLWTAEFPPCVAVTAIGECFNYLFDERNTDAALTDLVGRIYGALCPGGLFLLDVAEPGRVPGSGVQKSHREGPSWAVLVDMEEDRARRLLTKRITSFRKVGQRYRRHHEVHRLRLLPGKEVAGRLRDVGFPVRVLRAYGTFRFPPRHVGLLARKPV